MESYGQENLGEGKVIMIFILILVMISLGYTYVKTCQVVCVFYVQLTVCQVCFNKTIKRKKVKCILMAYMNKCLCVKM